jgi:rhodanese-related sulfurtransferase
VKLGVVRQTLLLIALAFLPAIGQALYLRDKVSWQSPLPPSESVTLEQAQAWGATAIWLDARPDEEFARDHVPGALSLNEDRWNDLVGPFLAMWAPDKKVIVYCSSQGCNASREVAKRLREEAQIKNVFVLQGGWEAWLKQNR